MGAQSAELRESCQRGPNENTNCLFRQYFPAGVDFLRYSRVHLNKAAHHLNERLRKTLEFETRRSGLTALLRRPVEITRCSVKWKTTGRSGPRWGYVNGSVAAAASGA
jgi:hypothetical protein